ncbi:MAG: thiolase family protein [Candidatus Binatia bacterium]
MNQTSRASSACIVGLGHTPLAARLNGSAWALQAEAVRLAVAEAGLSPCDVDGLITEPGYSQGVVEGITPHFLRLGAMLGLDPRYTYSEVIGGASSVAMVQRAAMAIDAGLCAVCVCVFGDAPSMATGTWSYGRGDDAAFGLFGAAGLHALAARRHMTLYGTQPEQLGEIAVTCRRHAGLTPHAQQHAPLTIDEYMASRYLVEPLRILDCCLISDGAGAVVVSTQARARDLKQRPVSIVGFGQAHHLTGLTSADYLTQLPALRAGQIAFQMAGVTHKDIDVAELYDCFTIVVLLQLEDYGFCAKGEGGAFASNGNLGLAGTLPTNTAGGLLSEGFGGGMFHIIEAVRQLRGDCGDRQVQDAEVALVSGHGLGMNTHATLILGRN